MKKTIRCLLAATMTCFACSALFISCGGHKGAKEVTDSVVVPPPPAPAPVVIAADDPLTKSVNDAIKDYPGVAATVKDGEVTLTGEIKRANLQKLMMNLHTLKPKKINNQLTIK